MTNEDKIKVLAELDGLSDLHWDDSMCERLTFIGTRGEFRHKIVKVYVAVPDYLTSYDAIIPLIQKHYKSGYEPGGISWATAFYESLPDNNTILKATPEQLCDALIKAVGKWKD